MCFYLPVIFLFLFFCVSVMLQGEQLRSHVDFFIRYRRMDERVGSIHADPVHLHPPLNKSSPRRIFPQTRHLLKTYMYYKLAYVAFVKTAPRGRSPRLTPVIIFIFNHGLCDVGFDHLCTLSPSCE